MIDPDLDQLSSVERCAEVIRYTLQSIEHWLSQGGWLREWIRLNLWLAVVLIAASGHELLTPTPGEFLR